MPILSCINRLRLWNEPIEWCSLSFLKFAEAVGLNKRKYHIAGTSLGGFIVGIHASLFPKNLASALLICPAGINSPIKSDMLKAFEEDEKILLLPKTTEEFIKMINFLVFKPVKFPKFIVAGIMQARLKAQDFYYRSTFFYSLYTSLAYILTGPLDD